MPGRKNLGGNRLLGDGKRTSGGDTERERVCYAFAGRVNADTGWNGTGKSAEEQKVETEIVFISCNREMALQGYEVAAARYLAKPLEKEKLTEAVRFCYGKLRNCKEILLPVDGYMRKIAPNDIYYIEIIGRKSRIMQETQEWDTSLSMKELEEILLGQGFVRCHQSFLVNFSHVKNFRTSSMELTDGRSVPVSKHRVKEVRQAFSVVSAI